MWIPRSEWKAFVPQDPREGQTFAAPESFALRLFKYHLDPERGLGEAMWFTRSKADEVRVTISELDNSPLPDGLSAEMRELLRVAGAQPAASYVRELVSRDLKGKRS